MKMKSILSGLIVVCAACMFLASSCSQASNKPTEETPMAIVSVRYIIDDVDAAIEFYIKLTEQVARWSSTEFATTPTTFRFSKTRVLPLELSVSLDMAAA
jgi:hypothetical protein